VRAGFGTVFGAIELPGGAELTLNLPWSYTAIITNHFENTYNCYTSPYSGAQNTSSACPSTGVPNPTSQAPSPFPVSLELGASNYLSGGLSQFAGVPNINRSDYNIKTPYTSSYNLTVERQIGKNMIATVGYVGNIARHSYGTNNFGQALGLTNSDSSNQTSPFPVTGGNFYNSSFTGESMYNALQSKLEKRLSDGLSFLATYTWSRAMDDSNNPGIQTGPGTYRNTNLIPSRMR